MSTKQKTTTPKPQTVEPSALTANPRAWRTLSERRGFAAIPHTLDSREYAAMLHVYRVGVSYPPQAIKGTGTRFDGQTLHVMTMSSRHLAEDTRLNRRTCLQAIRRLVEQGWAARIRTGKKGQRGTPAYVFFTADQRQQPRVTQSGNGASGAPFRSQSNGAPRASLNGASGAQNARMNGAPGANEVSQSSVLPERKRKDSSSSGVAESSAGSNPALPLKPDPALIFDWAKTFVVREQVNGNTEGVERTRLKAGIPDDEWSAALEKVRAEAAMNGGKVRFLS